MLLRETLASLGLECFPKTSGSKGLQVYAPLNRGEATYDETKPLVAGARPPSGVRSTPS